MAVTKQATGTRHNKVAARKHEQRPPVVSLTLGLLTFIGMMISLWMIFIYAPTDAIEGNAQRIFYFHVPSAWIGMLAFGVLALSGTGYMVTKDERWDWLARAAAEIGAVFITLALITGSIWGRTTWGAWWTWDPKLTATLILWFMYIGYLMLRSYMGRTSASAYAGAVLGIVGVVDVPIIYLSVQWWRGQHPTAEVGVPGALPPSVVLTLMVSLATFTLLYCFLMVQLYQLQKLQTLTQRLRASVE
ncbi:MAG TPA: cytochrome c biogenesis protein CcsA [Ktedonobacteraceae bacterium]|jgi:heme exporter protein C|nr:cytochrome c biogenesis protein CcsA [Ktedonobacteraceae bacterium]